jgi:hypothetical protein
MKHAERMLILAVAALPQPRTNARLEILVMTSLREVQRYVRRACTFALSRVAPRLTNGRREATPRTARVSAKMAVVRLGVDMKVPF